ncbi:MAG TPA: hypothetical protein VFU47_11730 [Armatimonadota bacterium]|nr:hypothetical protein [Armatimonadota bacterium]
MQRKRVLLGLALMVSLAVGAAAPLMAGRGNPVPFKGSISGILQRHPLNDPATNWSVEVSATGNVSQMGRVKADIAFDNIGLDTSGTSLVAVVPVGTGSFTAPNGDKVTGEYRWLASPTATPEVLSFVGTFTLTGGTGRYAGATGSGIFHGSGNIVTSEVSATFDGFISARSGGR